MPRTKLTPKQSAFVAEYLVDFNATQAAVRAGYSVKAAAAIARETLQNPQVAAALAAARAQRAKRTEITADRVLREIAILAFSDVRNYEVSADGKLTLREGVPDAAWRAVSSVKHKIHPGGRDIEYRLWEHARGPHRERRFTLAYSAAPLVSAVIPTRRAARSRTRNV